MQLKILSELSQSPKKQMLCVISHVWFLGFIWIYKNVAACNMRAEGKLSKETTRDQGEEKR